MFYITSLEDYPNILSKYPLNIQSNCNNNDDNDNIILFNNVISKLESVLLIYHPKFYNQYKQHIPYYSNIKVIIVTTRLDYQSDGFTNFGDFDLKDLDNKQSILLFKNMVGSFISEDNIFFKPLMKIISTDIKLITKIADDINSRLITPNGIIYKHISNNYKHDQRPTPTIITESILSKDKYSRTQFKFFVDQLLFQIYIENDYETQNLIGHVSITNKGQKSKYSWSQPVVTEQPITQTLRSQDNIQIYKKEKQNIKHNDHSFIYHLLVNHPEISLDTYFNIDDNNRASITTSNEMCLNLVPISGSVELKQKEINTILENSYGSLSYEPTKSINLLEIDAIGYSKDRLSGTIILKQGDIIEFDIPATLKLFLLCKCCFPPQVCESPMLLSDCNHIVCKHTIVQLNRSFICPLCNVENDSVDE